MLSHLRDPQVATAAVPVALWLLQAAAVATGTVVCYKDQNPSNPDPYNIYQCEDTAKPNCCKEGDLSTCCDYDPTQRTILQQLTIWGVLLATMIGLIFIYLCCFRAGNNNGTEIRASEKEAGCRGAKCCFFWGSDAENGDGTRYRQEKTLAK